MKSPIPLLILMPLPPVIWCSWSLSVNGSVDQVAALITLGLLALGWGGAWYSAHRTRQIVGQRVYVDIRHNHITVSDGFQVAGAYSSDSCLIADPIALGRALETVADRAFAGTNRLFSRKESVHLRIWPGSNRLSSEDVAAVGKLADELFLDPEVEVVGQAGDVRTAMQA